MTDMRNLAIGIIGSVIGGFISLLFLPEMQLAADIIRENLVDAVTVASHYLMIGYLAIKVWHQEQRHGFLSPSSGPPRKTA